MGSCPAKGCCPFLLRTRTKNRIMKNLRNKNTMLRNAVLLLLSVITFTFTASCSDDDNRHYDSSTAEDFRAMKNSYEGHLSMPDNTVSTLGWAVADDNSGQSVVTNLTVADFPTEYLISAVWPHDYTHATVTSADAFTAPIDSLGNQEVVLNFKTDYDRTPQLKFAFTLNGESHSGWARISAEGQYFISTHLMMLTFTVRDLVIDNTDYSFLTPITISVEGEPKNSK